VNDGRGIPRLVLDDTDTPVAVAVECEAGSLGPLVTDVPQHQNSIQLVECIFSIKQSCTKACVLTIPVMFDTRIRTRIDKRIISRSRIGKIVHVFIILFHYAFVMLPSSRLRKDGPHSV
jgi:hypothetical protein